MLDLMPSVGSLLRIPGKAVPLRSMSSGQKKFRQRRDKRFARWFPPCSLSAEKNRSAKRPISERETEYRKRNAVGIGLSLDEYSEGIDHAEAPHQIVSIHIASRSSDCRFPSGVAAGRQETRGRLHGSKTSCCYGRRAQGHYRPPQIRVVPSFRSKRQLGRRKDMKRARSREGIVSD